MKRILLLISLLALAVSFSDKAYAQLNITQAVETKPEKIMTMQLSYSYLYRLGNGDYEYWARTDNRFDKNYTTLFLGNSPETVLKTLNDLKYLMENEVAAVNVQQEDGDIVLTFAKQLGARMLWMKQVGQGGRSWISLQMVDKLIDHFTSLLPKEDTPEGITE